ncbi:hypothetical protein E2C01_033726 [Portunus trituberculatus]|uniref:Uncharacterized protein n=1 Tax=Portunus trituberculatus TaxID=210409 RepID=A0A5B7EZK9_PORTR|nr:hypothetical protein [Portunus trituberculatus]
MKCNPVLIGASATVTSAPMPPVPLLPTTSLAALPPLHLLSYQWGKADTLPPSNPLHQTAFFTPSPTQHLHPSPPRVPSSPQTQPLTLMTQTLG